MSVDPPRCYTVEQLAALLQVHVQTVYKNLDRWRADHIVEELRPPIGRSRRFRADVTDAWLRGTRQPAAHALNPRKLRKVG